MLFSVTRRDESCNRRAIHARAAKRQENACKKFRAPHGQRKKYLAQASNLCTPV